MFIISLIGDALSIIANFIEIWRSQTEKDNKSGNSVEAEIAVKIAQIRLDSIKSELEIIDPDNKKQVEKLLQEYNALVDVLRNTSLVVSFIEFYPRHFQGYQSWDVVWKKPLILHDPKGEF